MRKTARNTSPATLAEVVRLHKLWLTDAPGGRRAQLQDADLWGANLRSADLRRAELGGADLRGAELQGANLRDAELQGAILRNAALGGADLRDADLWGANLRDADLQGADLRGAKLRGAKLRGATLRNADLRNAILQDADLWGANLRDADLQGADLRRAKLRGAELQGAKLQGANLCGVKLQGATLPEGVTWEQYVTEVVPALLVAGGRPLTEVATAEHWACHTWTNCPMHAAFGAASLGEVPDAHREAAALFIQRFDAGLLPCHRTNSVRHVTHTDGGWAQEHQGVFCGKICHDSYHERIVK
jgi:uncharacterized protein YjbI with pentapeptide repeats